jgi:tRNA wybutosine-synthesizing protein 2
MEMRMARIGKQRAEDVRNELSNRDAVRTEFHIAEVGDQVLIPVNERISDGELLALGAEVVYGNPEPRWHYRSPYDEVVREAPIPNDLKDRLPRKWELLGDVLLIRLPSELMPYKATVAETYARALNARAVCLETGGISGVHRTPQVEVVFGRGTETVHKENGILYKLDVAKVMFSSGNMEEKRRMASLDCRGENIVDMFAGIGYFTLPLAVHAKAKRVVACEISPVAFGYLVDNIDLNHVENAVQPFLGDNRDLPGYHWADRVLMGYVGTTEQFLPKAFELVKSGGVIHYHEVCPIDEFPQRPLKRITESAGQMRIEVLRQGEVKSYAPSISHYVIDFRVTF